MKPEPRVALRPQVLQKWVQCAHCSQWRKVGIETFIGISSIQSIAAVQSVAGLRSAIAAGQLDTVLTYFHLASVQWVLQGVP